MNTKIRIYCLNLNRYIEVDGGTTLREIAETLSAELPLKPICARVNNKTEALAFAVYAPKDVEFLDRESDSGRRCYTRSLCMMLYKALNDCYPGSRLSVEHSLPRGYFCRVTGLQETVDCDRLTQYIKELHGRKLPFVREEGRTPEVMEKFRSQGLDDKVLLLETASTPYTVFYTLDGLADSYYGCLAPDTGHIDEFALTPYNNGFLLRGYEKTNADMPQEKLFKAFTDYLEFNKTIGVSDVGQLNRAVEQKQASSLINVAEALHHKYISNIADRITERYHQGGARIVLVAGPSSSGKTTTTKRLAVQLLCNRLKPVMISLDDYFVEREMTPRDETGDYDYESIHALDLKLFNEHLNAILRGERVELPTYSFELGKRLYKGNHVQLDEGSVLLIEGIHGLNPELTAGVEENQKFRVYVSALTTLAIDDHNWVPTTDTRLLRRIVRDYKYRGTSALDTLRRWKSVRRGEEKWIFPYQENADAMFNSSLIFELGVIKTYAEDVLGKVPSIVPEYATAYRLRKFLSYFHSIPAGAVPPTSLLREFLGGSSFHY